MQADVLALDQPGCGHERRRGLADRIGVVESALFTPVKRVLRHTAFAGYYSHMELSRKVAAGLEGTAFCHSQMSRTAKISKEWGYYIQMELSRKQTKTETKTETETESETAGLEGITTMIETKTETKTKTESESESENARFLPLQWRRVLGGTALGCESQM